MIGLRKNLVVLDFNEKEREFTLLKELDKVCKSDIVDFEFREGMLFAKGYQEDYISVLNFNLAVIQKQLSQLSDKANNESKNSTVTKIERSVSQVRAVDTGSIMQTVPESVQKTNPVRSTRSDYENVLSEKTTDRAF